MIQGYTSNIRTVRWESTFLAKHIRARLNSIQDVLALQSLHEDLNEALIPIHSAEAERRRRIDEFVNLELFFQATDRRPLYRPVSPMPFKLADHINIQTDQKSTPHKDLCDLLTATGDDPFSVLLCAKSGAGKTVAMLKAFWTAARRELGKDNAVQLRCVPCWLRAPPEPADGMGNILHQCLLATAFGENLPKSIRQYKPVVQNWLDSCGPLLVFVDLNSVSKKVRRTLATELREWILRERETLPVEKRSRFVVAYRSTAIDDAVFTELNGVEPNNRDANWCALPLRPYDLRIMPVEEALDYLYDYALVCNRKRIELNVPMVTAASFQEEDRKRLEALIKQHTRGGDALISTPLLMYFVSIIPPDRLKKIETLADLYAEVVKRHLARERRVYGRPPKRLDDEDSDINWRMIALMTRVAMAMQSKGPDETRITKGEFDQLLNEPPNPSQDDADRTDSAIFNNDVLTGISASGQRPQTNDDQRAFLKRLRTWVLDRCTLLKREGNHIGFLHDSFQYMLLGVHALRFYHGIDSPANLAPSWPLSTAKWIAADPAAWLLPVVFLDGLIDDKISLELCVELLCEIAKLEMKAKRGHVELFGRLLPPNRPDSSDTQPAEKQILRRMKIAADYQWGNLLLAPSALGSCIHAVLKDESHTLARGIVDRLRHALDQVGWIEQLTPVNLNIHLAARDLGEIRSVAVLGDGRVACGTSRGNLHVVEPGRELETWGRELGSIRSVAALGDGRVACAMKNGDLYVLGSGGRFETWGCGLEDILSVTVLGGGRVACATFRGDLHVVGPGGQVETWGRGLGFIWSVAALGDGRVVCGIKTGDLCVLGSGGQFETWGRGLGDISSVAALGDGRVACGTSGGELHVVGPGGQVESWGRGLEEISSLAALGDGRVVCGMRNGDLLVFGSGGRFGTWGRGLGKLLSVAAVGDGRVASGTKDGDLYIVAYEDQIETWGHGLGDVRYMVGVSDGRVACVNAQGDLHVIGPGRQLETWRRDLGEITTVAALKDGGVACGMGGGDLHVIAPGGRLKTWGRGLGEIRSLAELADGRVACETEGGDFHVVGSGGQLETWRRGLRYVRPLAAIGDGRVVCGTPGDHLHVVGPHGEVETWGLGLGQILSVAALGDGRVACLTEKNDLHVVGPGGLRETWGGGLGYGYRYYSNPNVSLLAGLGDGRVACGLAKDTLHVFGSGGQFETWGRGLGDIRSVAALGDGRVVCGTWEGNLHVVGSRGQLETWGRGLGHIRSMAALGAGRVAYVTWESNLHVVGSGGQFETWGRGLCDICSVAALDDGRVACLTTQGHLHVVGPDGPPKIWSRGNILSIAALGDGRVACAMWRSVLGVVGPGGQSEFWAVGIGDIKTMALLGDGRVVCGTGGDNLHVIGPGGRLETLDRDLGEIKAVTALTDGRVLCGTREGYVYAIGLGSNRQTLARMPGEILFLAATNTGCMIAGTTNGRIIALDHN
ncbi:MAG: hypothetical protein ABSH22_10495, partial [Tepidisphaeraceae bacterium]